MPQGYGQPLQSTRPTPYRLRQDLGYVPASSPTAGGSGSLSGNGILITGGNQPDISLAPIDDGQFLGNLSGLSAVPQGYDFIFINLRDVPASYSGESGKSLRVNAGETGLEFFTPTSGGVTSINGETGAIIIAEGTNVTIVEFPAGTFTISASGGSSVSYVPLSMGTEPLTFISDGSGHPVLIPFTP